MMGTAAASISSDTPLATAISVAWPIRPNPVMSVQACTGNGCRASAAALLSMRIDATARATTSSATRPNLMAVPMIAGADGLGEQQHVTGLGAGVGPHARRVDRTGHGIAELDFAVAHGVAAEQRHARLAQGVHAAAEDRANGVGVEGVFGKGRNRERREGTSAHGVDVAQRIGGRNLPVEIGVVDDGREEVDRLHQRRT